MLNRAQSTGIRAVLRPSSIVSTVTTSPTFATFTHRNRRSVCTLCVGHCVMTQTKKSYFLSSDHLPSLPCHRVPALPLDDLGEKMLSLKHRREKLCFGRACPLSGGLVQRAQEILGGESHRLEPLRPEEIRRQLVFRAEEKHDRRAHRHRCWQRVQLPQYLLDVVYGKARQGGRVSASKAIRSTPNVGSPSLTAVPPSNPPWFEVYAMLPILVNAL